MTASGILFHGRRPPHGRPLRRAGASDVGFSKHHAAHQRPAKSRGSPRCGRYGRPMIVRLLLALIVVALASGCVGPSADELRQAARSLVPAGSEVVDEVEADCVELARSPSCVHLFFLPPEASRQKRVTAVERRARAAGWEAVRAETFIGGSHLRFRRSGLRAIVYVSADERLERCRHAPTKECADAVSVEPE